MLNISENSINHRVEKEKFQSFSEVQFIRANLVFRRWLIIFLLILLGFLFLPWTQNIQTKGNVTTLLPAQRPQTIQSTIDGRIEKWFVREGQLVQAGDTIVFLSEIKTEYFDPDLVNRTGDQVLATDQTVRSYDDKATALERQIRALGQELEFKQKQLLNKIRQKELKVVSDSIEMERSRVDYDIALRQLDRTEALFDKGLKSLTEVEQKKLKVQETNAKLVGAENKLQEARQELTMVRLERNTLENDFASKIAKTESDRFSTLSDKFNAEVKASKLRVSLENYNQRRGFHYITAPQNGYINRALVGGIGETVKEGQSVVSIMPSSAELAVEMFVRPIDLPLIEIGNEVNFIFDGWPAFVFSGWPNLSFGTFSGKVVAIENVINNNAHYRILVAPDASDRAWPELLRVGAGARCIALLNDVPVWYELWRRLNGFPPDFYGAADKEDGELKKKAPIRSVK